MGEKVVMKTVANAYILGWIIAIAAISGMAQDIRTDKVIASEFENRVREYTKRREALESELPQLSKQATAEEISAHKSALLKKVLADRKGARHGYIFTPDAEKLIRSIVTTQYAARDRMELRKELAEAENKTVAVKVNAVYPEAAELLEMPPTLLLALPQLPKQVRYRFVGTNLLIVDRENHLIVDYMTNALP
jgi:hypothetical protein